MGIQTLGFSWACACRNSNWFIGFDIRVSAVLTRYVVQEVGNDLVGTFAFGVGLERADQAMA